MIDIFEKKPLNFKKMVCHSGGAEGADKYFEKMCKQYGVKVKAYSYKTNKHKSKSKVEISEEDYREGIKEVNKANKWLGRFGIHKYMNLLARNWPQVKYSKEVFTIGQIIEPGQKGRRGYYNKSKFQVVDGGTGYTVQMAINNKKDVYVFDQICEKWFIWSYTSSTFTEMGDSPVINYEDFAGVGTRQLEKPGEVEIENIFKKTFSW